MSYSVDYLILIDGERFSAHLDRTRSPTPMEREFLLKENTSWEGRIDGSSVTIWADLSSSAATLVATPVKYAHLNNCSGHADAIHVIREFETLLATHFPHVPIFRIDELRVDEWSAAKGETWLRNDDEVHNFVEWLEQQDNTSWKRIQ